MMFLFLATLAFAAGDGDGVRCVAVWRGPEPGCTLNGGIEASATRSSSEAAAKAARRTLSRALELAASDLAKVSDRSPGEYTMCNALPLENADLSCTAEESDTDGDFCFVTFDDPECWDGTVLTFERTGWRSQVDGRRALCEAVDARLVKQNYRDVEERRVRCQESCAIGVTISCPPER